MLGAGCVLLCFIVSQWIGARANTPLSKKALDQAGLPSGLHGHCFRLVGSSLHAHLVGICFEALS